MRQFMEKEVIAYLKELVDLPSISSDKAYAADTMKVAETIKGRLEALGAEVKIVPNEMEGKNPLLLGKLGADPSKKRILVYSHMDVQPAALEDGWTRPPFELTEDEDYVYGRGVSDDKGPIVATHYAIKQLLDTHGQENLPINIAFCYEGEEESSSGGFEETVSKHKDYFEKIDGMLILDTAWFRDEKPSLDYGLRGMSYNAIEISGPNKDQHSGLVGGSIQEPMTDLAHIFSKLITPDGKILIDGFYDDVLELSEEEDKLYEDLNFDLEGYKTYLGMDRVLLDDPKTTLQNMWRNPSLSIHGIEGAFSGPGGKTVVPAKVTGKVSMRLVPNQEPAKIAELFKAYVEKEFANLNSANKLEVKNLGNGDWWLGDITNYLFEASKKAIIEYWGVEPDYARVGGSIPIIPFMENLFGAPALGVGVGQTSDGQHSQNERLRKKNLFGAIQVIAKTFEYSA